MIDPRALRSAAARVAAAATTGDVAREALGASMELSGARRGLLLLGPDPARPELVSEACAGELDVRRGPELPAGLPAEAVSEALREEAAGPTIGSSWLPLRSGGRLVGLCRLDEASLDAARWEAAELIAAVAAGAFARASRCDAVEGTLRDAEERARLAERLAALGTAVSAITHELKNPIGFVNNFAEMSVGLAADLVTGLGALRAAPELEDGTELADLAVELSRNLARIREHGRRAEAVVRGTLQRARGRAGEVSEVHLNTLVREYARSAADAQPPEGTLRVPVQVALDPGVGKVRAVPEEIGRVVLNLVANAIDAARAHHEQVGEDLDPEVRVETRALGAEVEVRVRDNGAGITAAVGAKLFRPFFTTKPFGEGTGLGLPLSREIVERHGGEIRYESVPGRSTEFVVRLPRDGGDLAPRPSSVT